MRPVKAPFFDYIDAGQRKTYDDSIGGFVSIEHYEYESDEYTIGPGEFVLGTTIERIHIPRHMSARFEGKSSLGRIGLMTHVTAGFVDPGFSGNITLEIHNVSPNSVKIHSGDPIGQLCFYYLHTPATELYGQRGNHYQGQIGTTVVRH
jgi:dCTP deaminase